MHREFRLSSTTSPDHQISASPAGVQPKLQARSGKPPVSFELNRGQSDGQVKCLSRGSGCTLFVTGDEVLLTLRRPEVRSRKSVNNRQLLRATDLPLGPLISNLKSQIESLSVPGVPPPMREMVCLRLVGAHTLTITAPRREVSRRTTLRFSVQN
jgi:hypothetical protein